MTDRPLDGKVALVTGAARGIGKAVAIELGRLGADVVVSARTVQPRGDELTGTIGETVTELEAVGARGFAVRADLSEPADVRALITTTLAEHGGVDILVNNAADTSDNVFRGFWETSPESWAAQVQLNLNVMYELMHGFAPGMKERGRGIVVNLGSIPAISEGLENDLAVSLGAAYPTTKVAIFAMSTLLAKELAADGIAVVTLTPGPALTESFVMHAAQIGFDPSFGTPVELPVRAVTAIVTADDPMRYAGRWVDALTFATPEGA